MWRYSKEQFELALFYLFALFVNRLPPCSTCVCNYLCWCFWACKIVKSSFHQTLLCIDVFSSLLAVDINLDFCGDTQVLIWQHHDEGPLTVQKLVKCDSFLHLYPGSLLCLQFFRSSLSFARKDNMCKTENFQPIILRFLIFVPFFSL